MVMHLHYHKRMKKILRVQATLTERYQTTIPEPIREALHLNKRDKIEFTIDGTGKVSLSRSDNNEDPLLSEFLIFLANDIKQHPEHIKLISATLAERATSLVSGVEVDLNAPLSDEDE